MSAHFVRVRARAVDCMLLVVSQDWFVSMGIDVRYPLGMGERSLIGHRLLLGLHQGPKTGRELHALLGRKVRAADRRAALAELQSTGLVAVSVAASGSRGGRPRETWTLRYPGSSAVRVAQQAVLTAQQPRPRRRRELPWRPPTLRALRRAGLMPPEGGRPRRRRLKPVPADQADEICEWIASGHYLRDFCRRPGTPCPRTVYNWARKDPEFGGRFRSARDFGEWMIREQYADHLHSPSALAALGSDRAARREFNLRYIRPIDLRLQRWRRHPRRRPRPTVIPN